MNEVIDLAIVGGGTAGMAAALVCGRASLDVAVFNTERARNRVVRSSHGFLTRDGASPSLMLTTAREQLANYPTLRYRTDAVIGIERAAHGFSLTVEGGALVRSRRVLIATGMRDDLESLGLPGLGEVYGHSVFPCPFCDGFELRDKPLAVFAHAVSDDVLQHYLAMVQQLSSADLRVFFNGALPSGAVEQALGDRGIAVVSEAVTRLHSNEGQLRSVELEDGRVVMCEAGFCVGDYAVMATSFAEQLGAHMSQNPVGWTVVSAEDDGSTSIPGLFVAGDVRMGFSGLMVAAAQGSTCAAGIVRHNAMERWGA